MQLDAKALCDLVDCSNRGGNGTVTLCFRFALLLLHGQPAAHVLERAAHAGRVLFLLDGLDEAGDELVRRVVAQAVRELSERLDIRTGIDLGAVLSAAEDVVTPIIRRMPVMDRASITQGYAGVYSSFLIHAERAAERYGVPAHEILTKVGEYGYVGGQEDMIIDVAIELRDAGKVTA